MPPALRTATLIALAALFSPAASADNFNRCVAESAGLGGYQFKNNCTQTINVFFRPGGIEGATGGGSWRSLTLRSGEMKVVNSYSSPIIACPTSHQGKEVTIDPKTRDCIVRQGR